MGSYYVIRIKIFCSDTDCLRIASDIRQVFIDRKPSEYGGIEVLDDDSERQ